MSPWARISFRVWMENGPPSSQRMPRESRFPIPGYGFRG
jgi:hypothetical protein